MSAIRTRRRRCSTVIKRQFGTGSYIPTICPRFDACLAMANFEIRQWHGVGPITYLYEDANGAARKARTLSRQGIEFKITNSSGEPLTLADLEGLAGFRRDDKS